MTTAARTEFPAAERFSERINSDEENAELPAMQELSPLRAESAKQIAAQRGLRKKQVPPLRRRIRSGSGRDDKVFKVDRTKFCGDTGGRGKTGDVLRFIAWHLSTF